MFESPIDTNTVITALAAIAAWVAALFSYRSHKVSIRALELSELENTAKSSNLSAYLADSFRVYNRDEDKIKYVFSIAHSNKSETTDSITDVYLETFYVNSRNRVNHLITAHEPESGNWLNGNAKPAKLPLNIQPRSSITSWFVFSIPLVAEKAQKIEKYRVVARNSIGKQVFVESYILREVEYEKIS